MAGLIKFRTLTVFFFFFILLSLTFLFFLYPQLNHPQSSSSLISSYTQSIHHHISSFLPTSTHIKTYLPHPFQWSNWSTSQLHQLEDSLLPLSTSQLHPSNLPSPNLHSNTSNPIEPEFHSNGYFLLPQDPLPSHQPHPIQTLIQRAQTEWQNKLSRNSNSLSSCVAEYRSRYHRPPPFGFERWWDYVIKENVILKDEYDQIDHDLRPFLALEPLDLLHRSSVMSNERPETFTLSLSGQKNVTITGPEAKLVRAIDLANLINRFSSYLPAGSMVYNLTFTRHDQPAVQITSAMKQKMFDLAETGECESREANPHLGCDRSAMLLSWTERES